jgi:hypothetical protein
MKQTLIAALLVAGAAAASQSFALTRGDEIGEPGSSAFADRTLHVTPDTRYLNVQHDEVVTIDVNGRPVTWNFDGLAWQLNLQDIAAGAPSVQIYVSPSLEDKN